jgi:dipeptidyl aminopeptidase/acylaminoacyl peptidase
MRFPAFLLFAALLHLPQAASAADATRPAIADFFENPEFNGAKLSPSGDYLAVRVGAKGQRDRLAVLTLSDQSAKIVGSFRDADISYFEWVNDQRLAFTTTDRTLAQGNQRFGAGIFAVDRDGGRVTMLASRTPGLAVHRGQPLLPSNTVLLGQPTAQDSDNVFVTRPIFDHRRAFDHMELGLLNTVTGQYAIVGHPPAVRKWLLDEKGMPRVATTIAGDVRTVLYQAPGSKTWQALAQFNNTTGKGNNTFVPLAFGPDGTLYATANAGRDTSAVYSVDRATGKLSDQPVVQLQGYDFSGELIMGKAKLLGVRHWSESRDTVWFDQDMQALQTQLDQMLPRTINLITLPFNRDSAWVLVEAYSDLLPLRTILYHRITKQLTTIGTSHPKIKQSQMAHKKMVRYKARDGLEIPAWLTVPQGAGKNLPLVVLVHGGPYLRGGDWSWDAESQFLASRGYAVLQPEFRGSTGFGLRHFNAGIKQWGLKMQDDIADGARWAVAQGYADSKRICIAGASYGGYATLMGLIKDPDLYKCGVDWMGVTDINLMYSPGWFTVTDNSEESKQYNMPVMIGDPEKDAEQLTATSPLQHAARLKQPLLMAYGGEDKRVPLKHGSKFYSAVKETNPNVEWIEYEDEGHGWSLPKNRIDFWPRVEQFLDKQIGQPTQ